MKINNVDEPPQIVISKGINKGKLKDRPEGFGKLPGRIQVEPKFVSDPNHQKKILTGELRQLAMKNVAERYTMTKMDAIRIGKNFGYMSRALRDLPKDKHLGAGKAVLDHHFDCHDHCGDWCRRKHQTDDQKEKSAHFYRCKTQDAKLYKKLQDILERFVSAKGLEDVSHGMHTQANEAFNITITWYAPKNKVLCSRGSLASRLAIAVGVTSLGLLEYFCRLFSALGIAMTPDVLYFLELKDSSRAKRIHNLKKKAVKKKRIKRKIELLRAETILAGKERSKHEGTYKSGQNIGEGSSGGFTANQLSAARRRKNAVCPHCNKRGHSRTTHRNCDLFTVVHPRRRSNVHLLSPPRQR